MKTDNQDDLSDPFASPHNFSLTQSWFLAPPQAGGFSADYQNVYSEDKESMTFPTGSIFSGNMPFHHDAMQGHIHTGPSGGYPNNHNNGQTGVAGWNGMPHISSFDEIARRHAQAVNGSFSLQHCHEPKVDPFSYSCQRNSPPQYYVDSRGHSPTARGEISDEMSQTYGHVALDSRCRTPRVHGDMAAEMSQTYGLMAPAKPTAISLYMSVDEESLSDYQCLVRKQLEFFQAGSVDIQATAQGRNRPIVLGQVGIRCRHCSNIPHGKRGRGAVFYPSKLQNIYQTAQNISHIHLKICKYIPADIKEQLLNLTVATKSFAGGGKMYWAETARVLGVHETSDSRLIFT